MTINLTRKTKISSIPYVCCLFRLERTFVTVNRGMKCGWSSAPIIPACQIARPLPAAGVQRKNKRRGNTRPKNKVARGGMIYKPATTASQCPRPCRSSASRFLLPSSCHSSLLSSSPYPRASFSCDTPVTRFFIFSVEY